MSGVDIAAIAALAESQFVEELRTATERYFHSIDEWENAYRKYYRVSTPNPVTRDIEPFHREFLEAKRNLEAYIPRARRLCLKYELSPPWAAVLRIDLGAYKPQQDRGSALSRGERNAVILCLAELNEAVHGVSTKSAPPARQAGFLRRLYELFF